MTHEIRINIRFNDKKKYMEVSKVSSYIRKGNKQYNKTNTVEPSMDHLCDFLLMMETEKGPASIHTTYTQSDGSVIEKRKDSSND